MTAPPAPRPAAPDIAGSRMAAALGRLLDKARGAREVLPHLAALERGLKHEGRVAINRIPEHWLGRITSQLSSLPLPDDEPPLHELLQCLSERLRPSAIEWEAPSMPCGFDPKQTVVIREISHSEFLAASDQLAPTMPLPILDDEARSQSL
ncbi:MAG: hypothetical protein ACK5Y8_17825 [Betaproteobacteria bacterium]